MTWHEVQRRFGARGIRNSARRSLRWGMCGDSMVCQSSTDPADAADRQRGTLLKTAAAMLRIKRPRSAFPQLNTGMLHYAFPTSRFDLDRHHGDLGPSRPDARLHARGL